MAKKIGILTFHCAHNYGAVLQAYATQRLLTDMGHSVEIIDYRPEWLTAPYRRCRLSRLKGKSVCSTFRHVVSETLLIPARCRRYRAFERFIESNLVLSKNVLQDSFVCNYDVLLVGSDQVWNKKITGGQYDPMYFADFRFPKGNCRYVADAASMESDGLSETDIAYLKAKLSNFDAISVREENLARMLAHECGVAVEHIVDPVLQVHPDVWRELAMMPEKKKPYVLLYKIRDHKSIDRFAVELAKKHGLEVVEVSAFPDGKKLFKADQSTGVLEFLGLIAGAEYVVTTSFHAVAFSTIFERPFFCFRFDTGGNSRQVSLLKSIGLESRMLSLDAQVPDKLGFENVLYKEKLSELRKRSVDFISRSVE